MDEVQADNGRIYVARLVPSGLPHSSRRLMLSAGTGTPQGSTEYDLMKQDYVGRRYIYIYIWVRYAKVSVLDLRPSSI